MTNQAELIKKLEMQLLQSEEKAKQLEQSQKRLSHLKQVLQAVYKVNQLIQSESDPQKLIEQVCVNLTNTMGYHNAWIALFDQHDGAITATATSSSKKDFNKLVRQLREGDLPNCMKLAEKSHDTTVIRAPKNDCEGCPLSLEYEEHAGICHYLCHQQTVLGFICVSIPDTYADDQEGMELFQEITKDLSFALYQIESNKQSNQDLETLTNIINNSPAVGFIYELTEGWPIKYISENCLHVLGYPAKDFLSGKVKIGEKTHPDDIDRVTAEINSAAGQKELKVFTHEPYRAITASGKVIWLQNQSLIKRDEQGNATHFQGVAFDVTRLMETETILKESQNLAQLGHWFWDVKTGSVEWSEQVYEIFGLSSDTFTPQIDSILALSPWPEEKQRDRELIEKATTTHQRGEFDQRFLRPDGTIGFYHSTFEGVYNEKDELVAIKGIVQDITKRVQIESEREQLKEQLNQSQKMESVGRLAGGIAHDFNNMLNVILGHTDLLLEKLPEESPFNLHLSEIENAATRSAELTRQLLAFARKQTVIPKVLDLNQTVGSMLKMLQRLIGEGIDLQWQPTENISPIRIDPTQVDQLLANLIVNARDAIQPENGVINIKTKQILYQEGEQPIASDISSGEYILLTVSDNGCGMDKETREKIFEPFFTTKEIGCGTGLGLSTVYGIVKQNNGFIGVESSKETGTLFKLYLPVFKKAQEDQAHHPESQLKKVAHGKETILLVEDEPTILTLAKMMLEQQGYTVESAQTPLEAIQIATEYAGNIDLLVTDVIMPEMNGRELTKKLLTLYPDLKRLFMSGYTADVIAHQGVLDEGVNFIQKPFNQKQLLAQVRMALDD